MKVGEVASAGNTGQLTSYRWLDVGPGAGDYFYRVRSKSREGAAALSNIVKASMANAPARMMVEGNPVRGKQVRVKFQDVPAAKYSLVLIDQVGRILMKKMIILNRSNGVETITPLQKLAAGQYRLQLTGDGG